MAKRFSLTILQCVSGPSTAVGKFFITETYSASDGLRTRVCNGVFDSLIDAQKEVERKEDL